MPGRSQKRNSSQEGGADSKRVKRQSSIKRLFQKQRSKPPTARPVPSTPGGGSSTSKTMVYTLENMPNFPGNDLNIGKQSAKSTSPNSPRIKLPVQNNVRKLVIRSPSTAATSSTEGEEAKRYYEETSARLKEAVAAILDGKPTNYPLEELYRGVETLCRSGKAPELWHTCLDQLTKQAYSTLQPKVLEAVSFADSSPDDFTSVFSQTWAEFEQQLILIRNVFFYLDRSYLLPVPKRRSIWSSGAYLFTRAVIQEPRIHDALYKCTEFYLRKIRSTEGEEGLSQLKALVGGCIHVDPENNEPVEFLIRTAGDISLINSTQQDASDIEQYATTLSWTIKREKALFSYLSLPDSACEKAVLAIERASLENSAHEKLMSNLGVLIAGHKFDLGSVIGTAFDHAGRMSDLCTAWGDNISRLVSTAIAGQDMVMVIIDHYQTHLDFLDKVFENNTKFADTLKSSFRKSLNARQTNTAVVEQMAKFADRVLRTSTYGADTPKTLKGLVGVFSYLDSKDIFSSFYQRDFAKRLIQNKSGSLDLEQEMLSLLKEECGPGFTQKFETMLRDLNTSSEIIKGFNESRGKSRISFNAHVLTLGSWPKYTDLKMNVPKEMNDITEKFKSFYLSQKSGRRLSWQHSLGHCVIKGRFPHGDKDIYATELQACVLLQFNNDKDGNGLTYDEIKQALGIDDESNQQLMRAVQSLFMGKAKLLIKDPHTKTVSSEDKLYINSDFKDKSSRIRVNQIRMRNDISEADQQRKEVLEEVTVDRHMEVQAAIVRIMKARKELKHTELIEEIISLTKDRGILNVPDIKKNIEILIEREFIDRSDANTYYYK
uniref:ARAD1D34496p n=1 Tax=Blastobotrys adeninivorans TaxID=409370 RepID=A0A060TBE1_BLAAD